VTPMPVIERVQTNATSQAKKLQKNANLKPDIDSIIVKKLTTNQRSVSDRSARGVCLN